MKKKKLIWIILLLIHLAAFSQEKAAFSIHYVNEPITEVLVTLENLFDVRFSYPNELIADKQISLDPEIRTLEKVLDEISLLLGISFQYVDKRYIIINRAGSSIGDLQVLDNVIVKAYLTRGVAKNKDASFILRPKELDILPGLTEADVLESVQQLPGVISVNETASGFTVRGGETDQNRIIWDGINIYHKGHLFGMISAFNPNSVEKIEFINKGTHPRFGERISSVVNITTSSKVADSITASVGINGINADAFVNIPVIKNKLSLHSSVRRSYTEVYESFTFDKLTEKTFQNTKIKEVENSNNEFYFTDYNVKLNYQPNANNLVSFSTIYIDNKLDYLVSDMLNNQTFNDLLSIRNEGYSFSWDKDWSSSISHRTQGYFSKYRLAYNFIEEENSVQVSDFDKRNVIFDSGISSELRLNKSEKNQISLGYKYSLKDVSYAFLESADLSFVLDTDEKRVNTHSIFANTDYRNEKFANINLGFRLNYFQELESLRIEPRVLISKELFRNLTLQFSGEIKNQIISEIDETILSDLSLENKLWRLVDAEAFPIIGGQQVSSGLIYSNSGWVADLDLYYKKVDGLTALSLGFLNPLDSGYHIGEQKVNGLDFFLKKDFNYFKMWISYSFNDVKSKFEGLNNEKYFNSNTGIKHAFTASMTYRINQFQLSIAWNWRTGKPFTKALFNEIDNSIFFEEINSEQLPDYHRLDVSSTYNFRFSKKNKLKGILGISVRNVYDQKNQLSLEYSGNNNLDDPIRIVDKFSLGFTPNFLFRVFW